MNPCLDIFAGWPRRYTYWRDGSWRTGRSLANRQDIEEKIRKRGPVGVWQCYGTDEVNDCIKRDVIVFELDTECNSLQCIRERYNTTLAKVSRFLKPYGPLVWWNGNKSVYWLIAIEPVDANYVLRPEWAELVKILEMDTSMLTSRHSFRLPCTPHPKTGRLSVWLDPATYKPIKTPQLPPTRVNSFYFLEPPQPKPAPRVTKQQAKSNNGFNVLEAVKTLVETSPRLRQDCRKRLAAFIGGMCATLDMTWEECQEYMHSLGVEWTREHEWYAKYYYERSKEGKSKFSFKSLIESDVWYSVKACL